MYYLFFYFFIAIAILSAVFTVFSNRSRLSSITIFILSFSGMLVLINAGYLAFIIIFIAVLYYTVNNLRLKLSNKENNEPVNNNMVFIIISSVFGAIIASVTGSTMWQGKVILNREIIISNLFTIISCEYYIFLLIILSAVPVILSFIKPKVEI